MANPEQLAILKEGVEAWSRWREHHPKTRPDLTQADLDGAMLSKAALHAAILDGAGLIGAKLIGANLNGAILTGTNLSGANLNGANLSWADLSWADLSEANLFHANFRRAKLDRADFTNARVGHTTFADVDLSTAIGLETIVHVYPSTVGIDTIYLSSGRIPPVFSRGCGVPENFIEYMSSLVSTGIEFYSLFISYSHKDEEFAKRLHADLQANGVRCWYAPEDMPGGKKLHEEIDAAIRMHDRLLLILSEHSMASKWVMTEMRRARKRELEENRRVLFPICICPFEAVRTWECFYSSEGIDLAEEIREYFIPDFSNWKDHDAYKLAFDRLLKDLQGKAAPLTTP